MGNSTGIDIRLRCLEEGTDVLIQARLEKGGLSGWILTALCPTLRRELLRYGYFGRRLGYGFGCLLAQEVLGKPSLCCIVKDSKRTRTHPRQGEPQTHYPYDRGRVPEPLAAVPSSHVPFGGTAARRFIGGIDRTPYSVVRYRSVHRNIRWL